jgi:hypothetical protein
VARNRTKTSVRAYRIGAALVILFIFAIVILYIGVPGSNIVYQGAAIPLAMPEPARAATHVPTPVPVRAIYMTSCVAASPSLRSNLAKLADETEINSIVIDVKSFDGHISFMPSAIDLRHAVGGCFVKDLQDFIDELHKKGIYVIARLAVFQDVLQTKLHPELAVKKATATSTVWKDRKGITWIDASAASHWDYTIALAKEAHGIGFDEINFDYIRFPSDGDMKDISYPWSKTAKKSEVMRTFFEYLRKNLPGITTSADLFGMTTTNSDDLNIGQILEHALANFDYVSPMVYPSHYPDSFLNLGDPNKHVYTVVKYSMDRAVARAVATTTRIALPGARIGTSTPAIYSKPSYDRKKLRPWLQDNNYPVTYTAEMVRDQIQAAYDTGLDSWMLWNAGNRYTRAALKEGI